MFLISVKWRNRRDSVPWHRTVPFSGRCSAFQRGWCLRQGMDRCYSGEDGEKLLYIQKPWERWEAYRLLQEAVEDSELKSLQQETTQTATLATWVFLSLIAVSLSLRLRGLWHTLHLGAQWEIIVTAMLHIFSLSSSDRVVSYCVFRNQLNITTQNYKLTKVSYIICAYIVHEYLCAILH